MPPSYAPDDADTTGEYIRLAFTEDAPEGPYIEAGETLGAVRAALGRCHFTPNWAHSANFRGENLNVARITRGPIEGCPDIDWWQTHVRGWVTGDDEAGCYLRAHFEPEPRNHPNAHLDGIGYDAAAGMSVLEGCLVSENIPIRAIHDTLDGGDF